MNSKQMVTSFSRPMRGDSSRISSGTAFSGVCLATTLPNDAVTRTKVNPEIAPPDNTFALVDEMLKRAISDVTQGADLRLRWEALAWLWVCCPDIADQLRLPWPEATDVQAQATHYMDRYAAF